MGPDQIHPKILKYLSSNECIINAICKLFEKCRDYEMILYIWKTVIVIPLHKKVGYILKVITDQFVKHVSCVRFFKKLIWNHIPNFDRGWYELQSTWSHQW